MLLLDDILFFPATSLMRVFRELHDAAEAELGQEGERIKAALSELYMMLETGRITEAEFDRQEQELLDRLENLEEESPDPNDEDADPDDLDSPGEAPTDDF
jgi:hypothetical protein